MSLRGGDDADHRAWLTEGERLARRRGAQELLWVEQAIRAHFGSAGLRAMRSRAPRDGGPFARERDISRKLLARLGLRNFPSVFPRARD